MFDSCNCGILLPAIVIFGFPAHYSAVRPVFTVRPHPGLFLLSSLGVIDLGRSSFLVSVRPAYRGLTNDSSQCTASGPGSGGALLLETSLRLGPTRPDGVPMAALVCFEFIWVRFLPCASAIFLGVVHLGSICSRRLVNILRLRLFLQILLFFPGLGFFFQQKMSSLVHFAYLISVISLSRMGLLLAFKERGNPAWVT